MPAIDTPSLSTASASSPVVRESTPSKRKRSGSPRIVNGHHKAIAADDDGVGAESTVQDSIRDIWTVLESHDPSPSVLTHISSHQFPIKDDQAPSTKRTKFSPDIKEKTIEAKVRDGAFSTINSFEQEVEDALSRLDKTLKQETDLVNGDFGAQSTRGTEDWERRLAQSRSLKSLLKTLCGREIKRLKVASTTVEQKTVVSTSEDSNKPIKIEEDGTGAALAQDGRTVLTLFGNAAGHKQLFSSLQRPPSEVKGSGSRRYGANADVLPDFREQYLPLGISSAKVIRTEFSNVQKRPSTFADIFAPPPSLIQVLPPKPTKPPVNRETPVTFTRSTPSDSSTSRGNYATEKISTGHWLGYAGQAPAEEPTSPTAKRRLRDRALSMNGGDARPASSAVLAAHKRQVKEEALFRSVYSSFAPTHDNMGAIVSEESKHDLWWQRYGNYAFDQVFGSSLYPCATGNAMEVDQDDEDDEESAFAEAVADFDPEILKSLSSQRETDNDAEQILKEISEMIQTLYSFQRIRMSSLSNSNRDNFGYSSSFNDKTGPSTPSPQEIETYKALKAQLSLIIGTLPPYVVSKLNGEQLEELQISPHIRLELPDYRGVMEEDQASKTAKQQAFQAAVGAAHQHQRPNASTPHQHPPRSAHAPLSARPMTSISSKAGSTFSRQPLSSWQTPSQNHTATIQRPAYANAQNYNQGRPTMQTPTVQNSNPAMRGSYPQSQNRSSYQPNGMYATPTANMNFQPAQHQQQQQQQQQQQRPLSGYASNTSFSHSSPQKQGYPPMGSMQFQQRYNQPTPQQQQYQTPISSSQQQRPLHTMTPQQQGYAHNQYQATSTSPQPRPGSAIAAAPPPSLPNGTSSPRPQTPRTPRTTQPQPQSQPQNNVAAPASNQTHNQIPAPAPAQPPSQNQTNGSTVATSVSGTTPAVQASTPIT